MREAIWATILILSFSQLQADRFKDWLEKEVIWIISQAEKEQFKRLKTDEEKERFIEQFWRDRDPTPGTAKNEYKEEHYARLKYATETFREGIPGWRTDRGRIYIIHGPPVSVQTQADREVWFYSSNPYAEYYKGPIVLVFQKGASATQERLLSDTATAQARAARVPGQVPELLSQQTASSARYRLINAAPSSSASAVSLGQVETSLGETDRYIGDIFRSPGEVLEERKREAARRAADLAKAREMIEARVSYEDLPFHLSCLAFPASQKGWVYFSVEVPGDLLERLPDEEAKKVDLLCELKEEGSQFRVDALEETFRLPVEEGRGIEYLNRFQVPAGKFELSCLARDLGSGRMSLRTASVQVSSLQSGKLTLSSLILTPKIRQISADAAEAPLNFQDARFLPVAEHSFEADQPLFLYFQVYNFQEEGEPPAELYYDYQIYSPEAVHYRSPVRRLEGTEAREGALPYALRLDLSQLEPGEYTLMLKVLHGQRRQYAMQRVSFHLQGSPAQGSSQP